MSMFVGAISKARDMETLYQTLDALEKTFNTSHSLEAHH